MEKLADIGLIGLAVMGENLILNMESHGYTVAVYNRTVAKVDKFIEGRGAGKNFIGTHSIEELVQSLKRPRKVMLLVKAGAAVDSFIEQLTPHLEAGDIIIDGGNTHYPDTNRRTRYVEEKGLLYIGTGVSGGEEGALRGPSIMPGGSKGAWPHVKPIFQDIAAKVEDGSPCCDWVGENGAGHFVKMVHNGIEYGDMQMICETYQMMKDLLGMSNQEMHEVLKEWNEGELDSYLIEITRDILAYTENGEETIDVILDTAGQKGTGKWTAIAALEFGIPLTLIGEAVFARTLSAQKAERVRASKVLDGPQPSFKGDKKAFIEDLRLAAGIMKGRKKAENVQVLVVPGSQQVRLQAEAEGLDDIFKAAGAEWRYAGCSMCLGMNPDQLQPQQRSASTSNRNFEGRQGKGGRTHLVSPEMAAAAAIAGKFVDIRKWPQL